jgi:hypothetical protein
MNKPSSEESTENKSENIDLDNTSKSKLEKIIQESG